MGQGEVGSGPDGEAGVRQYISCVVGDVTDIVGRWGFPTTLHVLSGSLVVLPETTRSTVPPNGK